MSVLGPQELHARVEEGEPPFVLDIRPEVNYRRTAIDGSHNLPVYDELRAGNEAALRRRLDEIPRDRDVVVVCKMGIVANRATRLLQEEGYEAVTLGGGIHGWNSYESGSFGYKLRSAVSSIANALGV